MLWAWGLGSRVSPSGVLPADTNRVVPRSLLTTSSLVTNVCQLFLILTRMVAMEETHYYAIMIVKQEHLSKKGG